MTTQGCHITGRTSALSRTVHCVEPLPLFVAQRLVKLLERREDNLYGLDGCIQSLCGGVQASDGCERNRIWARRFDDFPCLRRCSAEIVESRFLISCRMDDLSDLIDRQIGQGGHQTGATFEPRRIGFSARLAIILLRGIAPAGGGAIATALIWSRPRLVPVSPHRVMAMVSGKRQVEIEPSQVDAKGPGWQMG